MDALIQYTIPVKGLGPGIHQYNFEIDHQFFSHFESSPVKDGQIKLEVTFDKRPDMYLFTFSFTGTVKVNCDRCLAPIDLPIEGEETLIVKFALEQQEESADIAYVHPEKQNFNIAKYAYEYLILSVPMIKVYECEEEETLPCNTEMLKYLDEDEQKEQEEGGNLPFKDVLKDWTQKKTE